ncbi:MAG: hypothetical protein M1820_007083 [Bogoriella megaspora]|nr:MAG: hypothetical protein M1820_007083 [Bogoriella megaspora]
MSLCGFCKNIPWENLPTVPEDLSSLFSGHKYIQAVLGWPQDVRGHPHHQSLDALRQAASYCSLCSLIRESAENVQKQLEELKPKWEAGEMRQYDWPTWEMWLVKRRKGGDGCWVMSFVDMQSKWSRRRKDKERKEAWIVAALGICVRDGDPLDSLIAGRPVEARGGTSTATARARKWLEECDKHPSCNPRVTFLPSRVIDVGDINTPEVHLWEPVPEGTVGKYVSLSYCWGESPGFTTTRATIEERKRGITIHDMPATYQDIVKVTRGLGLRYLWVDSLCICQDEHADWERESAKMLSTYSNAYLTVAASGAKGKAEGFLGPRPDRPYVELDYTRGGIQGEALAFSLPLREELVEHDYITLPNEPLSERAWGVQERMLSNRILLYSTSQMFYECNEGYRGEDGLFLNERFNRIDEHMKGETPDKIPHYLQGLELNKRPKRNILKGWYDLLRLYGPKKLSHATDKLPAISGLASLYSERIEEEYLAGLWRDQLVEGLVWQSLSYRRVSDYRAPSWSWASGDGIPAAGLIVDYDELATILDVNVTLKGENPFGEVTDGWIKIRAPMEQLYLILDGWDPEVPGHVPYENNVKVRTANGDPAGHHSRFDFAFTADDAPQEAKKIVKSLEGVGIFALILLKSRSWNRNAAHDEGTYHALIVKKVDGTENYQRLGFLHTSEKMFGRKPEEQPEEELTTLTLV